jgi:Zn-dependent peptidase ImmA (M78 family)
LTFYKLLSLDEAVVFVGAHEIFHFLRHSRQVGGRNGENEADQFAVVQLEEFRRASPEHHC